MARVLYDGLVEYEDGTPATTSQMAKDVVEFLNWSAEPEMDQRKKMGLKVLAVGSVLFALSVWVKRYVRSLAAGGGSDSGQVQVVAREDEEDCVQSAGGRAAWAAVEGVGVKGSGTGWRPQEPAWGMCTR